MVHSARSPAEAVPRPRPDGVPGYSQDPVHPGDTFTYDFVVPDAGIYWYHPHVMSAAQVGFGLYGAFLVEDPTEMVGIADDIVLVLSDIDVTDDGEPVRPLEWKDTVDIPHERTVRLAVRFDDRPGTWIFPRPPDRSVQEPLRAESVRPRSLVTASRWWISGLEMLGLGALVAAGAARLVAYATGFAGIALLVENGAV